MAKNLIKITTTFHNTWLVSQKKDTFSEENDILFGDTLRLSISKNDSYFFSEAIALTYNKEILSREHPTDSEIEFFDYMKIVGEKTFSKNLAAKYGLEAYITPISMVEPLNQDN